VVLKTPSFKSGRFISPGDFFTEKGDNNGGAATGRGEGIMIQKGVTGNITCEHLRHDRRGEKLSLERIQKE